MNDIKSRIDSLTEKQKNTALELLAEGVYIDNEGLKTGFHGDSIVEEYGTDKFYLMKFILEGDIDIEKLGTDIIDIQLCNDTASCHSYTLCSINVIDKNNLSPYEKECIIAILKKYVQEHQAKEILLSSKLIELFRDGKVHFNGGYSKLSLVKRRLYNLIERK